MIERETFNMIEEILNRNVNTNINNRTSDK